MTFRETAILSLIIAIVFALVLLSAAYGFDIVTIYVICVSVFGGFLFMICYVAWDIISGNHKRHDRP